MIVIDASIAIKWIKEEEEYRAQAVKIYENHASQKETILVPPFFFIEVANSLVTKSSTQPLTIKKELDFLYNSHLNIFEPDKNTILTTSSKAKKYKTTVYDMLYAVVAEKNNISLITADEKFVQKTKFPFVKLLSEI